MIHYLFIVNPSAGKGGGGRMLDPLRNELNARGISYDLVVTTAPGHATAAARTSNAPRVVAVGGDGTVNEVANGLQEKNAALGIIPAGSGNDFIKSVSIPPQLRPALDILFLGKPRTIDVGTVACGREAARTGNSSRRLFVNGVGVGFDAAVAARTREIRVLSGTALYIAAVLQTLGRYFPPDFTITTDHTTTNAKCLLIAVGNGRCAGGGFYLTPDARVDDGLLDVCQVEQKTIAQILLLMPKVMKGKHHDVTGVKMFQTRELHVSAASSFHVHADGEIVGENVNSVKLGLHQDHLTIIAG